MFIAARSDFSGDKVMVRGGESADTRTAARMGGGGALNESVQCAVLGNQNFPWFRTSGRADNASVFKGIQQPQRDIVPDSHLTHKI